MWPASAMLTGNGVAFILESPAPSTAIGGACMVDLPGDGGGLAAVEVRDPCGGRHVFNPSNIGLVACFLLLRPERAEPLDFWWGPMSVWLALALTLIVAGGLRSSAVLKLLRSRSASGSCSPPASRCW